MHDPVVFEDPHGFHPERFIRDGKLDPSVLDPLDFVFGFGRRFVGMLSLRATTFIGAITGSVPDDTLQKCPCSYT